MSKEFIVAKAEELRDGEMREVKAGETNVLLARAGGNFHAVGANCPHYGAPLVDGVLSGTRIVCPWHHACFSVVNGNLEEPPALDALPCFDVRVEDGNVTVILPDEVSDRRTPSMVQGDASADARTFVILGGGAAGYAAAQTLREDGFKGRVLMVTREDRAPYDRPNLSKDYLHGHAQPEWMPLRGDDFYEENNIEILFGKEVSRVDATAKSITFGDDSSQTYDALLVATGGTPRTLPIPGTQLKNVFTLRSFADSDTIIAAANEAKRAVVVGASFIAMEAAASLVQRDLSVTIVAPESVPFERILGKDIGAIFQQIHESKGVSFRLGAGVSQFEGNEKVAAVVLSNGERLDADLVVMGVGVSPATDFLSGVTLHTDGSIIVDENLRAADGLHAAGDVARFTSSLTGEQTRIEHWRTALQQGRIAAHNMVGKQTRYESVPFFWTRQFDDGLQYVGHAQSWDEIIYQGDLSARDFLAFYVHENRVIAVAGMNRDRDIAALEELLRLNRMPSVDEIRNGVTNFVERL